MSLHCTRSRHGPVAAAPAVRRIDAAAAARRSWHPRRYRLGGGSFPWSSQASHQGWGHTGKLPGVIDKADEADFDVAGIWPRIFDRQRGVKERMSDRDVEILKINRDAIV